MSWICKTAWESIPKLIAKILSRGLGRLYGYKTGSDISKDFYQNLRLAKKPGFLPPTSHPQKPNPSGKIKSDRVRILKSWKICYHIDWRH
jgi:hypothetical protein